MFKLLSPQLLDLPSNLREQPIVFNRESTAFHLIEMEFVYDPKIPSETEVTLRYELMTLFSLLLLFTHSLNSEISILKAWQKLKRQYCTCFISWPFCLNSLCPSSEYLADVHQE